MKIGIRAETRIGVLQLMIEEAGGPQQLLTVPPQRTSYTATTCRCCRHLIYHRVLHVQTLIYLRQHSSCKLLLGTSTSLLTVDRGQGLLILLLLLLSLIVCVMGLGRLPTVDLDLWGFDLGNVTLTAETGI